MIKLPMLAIALCALTAPPIAAQEPLEAVIDTSDAERFAALFSKRGGLLSEAEIEDSYLSEAGDGLALMRATRFGTAEALSAAIAQRPAIYRDAVERCLPIVKSAERDLRAIYLALAGLFPDRTLPRVEVVVGAGTAAGIASQGVQVIGLETLCAGSDTEEGLRDALRYFFAHETVHAFQKPLDASTLGADPLLALALHEGIADMVASLVLGQDPDAERDAWSSARRDELLSRFHQDRRILRESARRGESIATMSPDAREALRRWHFNYGNVQDNWRSDLGYWIGCQIASAYVDRASDRRGAIHDLVNGMDAVHVLEASGMSEQSDHGES